MLFGALGLCFCMLETSKSVDDVAQVPSGAGLGVAAEKGLLMMAQLLCEAGADKNKAEQSGAAAPRLLGSKAPRLLGS